MFSRIGTICIFFLMFLCVSTRVFGTVANKEQTDQVSRNMLQYVISEQGNWAGSDNPQIVKSRSITVNDTLLAYCYDIEPSGYIIVPILMEQSPVKACSEDYNLDLEAADGFAVMLRDVLAYQARAYITVNGSLESEEINKSQPVFGPSGRQQWDLFLLNESDFMASLAAKGGEKAADQVGPLMTTVWHQGYPYNTYCPIGDGGRTIVGCVSTAASQILRYHEWPPEGLGNYSYYWSGDASCNGSSPGETLTADFSDSYNWANMPNHCMGSCSQEEIDALSELCYEVGVAFDMDYGVCGSGSYMSRSQFIYPNYFRYMNTVEVEDRTDYSLFDWATMIRVEVESNRPIQYQIYRHSIVCDGWREVSGQYQVHMNYGWGDSHNAWYTVDELYCGWDGCATYWEWMLTGIEPDRGVMFTLDTTWGQVPFDVAFEGVTTLEPNEWLWSFGDGDSSYIQSPVHTYNDPGRFNVAACVIDGVDTSIYERTNCIIALADSMYCPTVSGSPGELVEVPVYICNSVPLEKIKIPVEYGDGSMNITLESFSTEGCRTEYFDTLVQGHLDPWGQRASFSIYNMDSSTPDLPAGSGPVLKLYFRIPSGATGGQTGTVIIDGYMSHEPMFYWEILDFNPISNSGLITLPFMCGDVAQDNDINLLDVLFLIDYIYGAPKGPAPEPLESGDVNADTNIDLLDILALIEYIYGVPPGPAPACP